MVRIRVREKRERERVANRLIIIKLCYPQFKGGNIYFGSQLQKFKSMVSGLKCRNAQ